MTTIFLGAGDKWKRGFIPYGSRFGVYFWDSAGAVRRMANSKVIKYGLGLGQPVFSTGDIVWRMCSGHPVGDKNLTYKYGLYYRIYERIVSNIPPNALRHLYRWRSTERMPMLYGAALLGDTFVDLAEENPLLAYLVATSGTKRAMEKAMRSGPNDLANLVSWHWESPFTAGKSISISEESLRALSASSVPRTATGLISGIASHSIKDSPGMAEYIKAINGKKMKAWHLVMLWEMPDNGIADIGPDGLVQFAMSSCKSSDDWRAVRSASKLLGSDVLNLDIGEISAISKGMSGSAYSGGVPLRGVPEIKFFLPKVTAVAGDYLAIPLDSVEALLGMSVPYYIGCVQPMLRAAIDGEICMFAISNDEKFTHGIVALNKSLAVAGTCYSSPLPMSAEAEVNIARALVSEINARRAGDSFDSPIMPRIR